MAVTEKRAESPAPPDVRRGELAVRYTFTGSPEKDNFDAAIVVGELADGQLEYDDEYSAFTAMVVSAAKIVITQSYNFSSETAKIFERVREGTEFVYEQRILLRNLLSGPEDITAATEQLTDNTKLRSTDLTWQVSILGFDNMRIMQHELFVASNSTPLDKPPIVNFDRTHPEIRADIFSFLGGRALDLFTAMSPTPPAES